MMQHGLRPHRPFYRRGRFWWPVGIVLGLIVSVVLMFTLTPWPNALIIRDIFQNNAMKVKKVMDDYAPTGVTRVANVNYIFGDKNAYLDVYYPDGTTSPLNTIVWTHGGAWVSGNKDNDEGYFKTLASHGYTVVALDYGYGPEVKYPVAVQEITQALAFIQENSAEYNVNPDALVLAGDSAGAQLTSQVATIITNPDYAAEMDISPTVSPAQIKGLLLYCGVYDLPALAGGKGALAWGFNNALWAYTGNKNVSSSPEVLEMSTLNHVTAQFPATYISGGNGDPLTSTQSEPMAKKLGELGVPLTTLFWPASTTPALPHEYQFWLNTDAAQTALEDSLTFLNQRFG